MAKEMDWDARGALVKAHIAPLRFLIGDWEGEGSSHGAHVRGRLRARVSLDESWVEVREQHWSATGALDHEELTMYRYDPTNEQLRAFQFTGHAWLSEHVIIPENGGLRWFSGPLAPSVEIVPDGDDALRVTVREAFRGQPTGTFHYRRI